MVKRKSAVFLIAMIAIVALATVGCIAKKEESEKIQISAEDTKQEEVKNEEQVEEKNLEVILYFAGENAEKLSAEKRMVNYETYKQNPQKVVLEELIKGPLKSSLISIIPKETKLLSVEVADRKAIVNFSKEFVDNHTGGSLGETMTIYGIVNSLTELKDIDSVEFKIDGESREEFKGHMIFNEPFERDETFIG